MFSYEDIIFRDEFIRELAHQVKTVIQSEGLNARKGEESHPNEMLQRDNKITTR